jgi:hypothetical protein
MSGYGEDTFEDQLAYTQVVIPRELSGCDTVELGDVYVPTFDEYVLWEAEAGGVIESDDGLSIELPAFGVQSISEWDEPYVALRSLQTSMWPYETVPGTTERILKMWPTGNPSLIADPDYPFRVTLEGYMGAQDGEVFRLRRVDPQTGYTEALTEGPVDNGGTTGPNLDGVEMTAMGWLIASAQ